MMDVTLELYRVTAEEIGSIPGWDVYVLAVTASEALEIAMHANVHALSAGITVRRVPVLTRESTIDAR